MYIIIVVINFADILFFEGKNCFDDDFNALHYLLFGDDQWWCKSDNVSVGGLSQQSHLFHAQTNFPRVNGCKKTW